MEVEGGLDEAEAMVRGMVRGTVVAEALDSWFHVGVGKCLASGPRRLSLLVAMVLLCYLLHTAGLVACSETSLELKVLCSCQHELVVLDVLRTVQEAVNAGEYLVDVLWKDKKPSPFSMLALYLLNPLSS